MGFRSALYRSIKQHPHSGGSLGCRLPNAVVTVVYTLRSIDYNYTCFRLWCIATPNRWNGIEIYIYTWPFESRNDLHYF